MLSLSLKSPEKKKKDSEIQAVCSLMRRAQSFTIAIIGHPFRLIQEELYEFQESILISFLFLSRW